jgi:hypothetical protein
MKTSTCQLHPLSKKDLISALKKIKPSAPGLDHFSPAELKTLAEWVADVFEHVAALFNHIDKTSNWPADLTKGAVSFLPKTDDDHQAPSDFRPLTIFSALYRLWASIRHNQLCEFWLPSWKPDCAYGLKQSLAADALAFHTCLDISTHAQEHYLTSGISYDMRKCFDTIPMMLVLQFFNFRGADSQATRALHGFYKQHHKYFKLEGSFDAPFRPHNGIIQGCPLSMLLLTSMISAWCDFCMAKLPQTQPRAYADDLSICNFAFISQELVTRTQQSHTHTAEFVQHTGMQLNAQKCFTFADRCVAESLPQITAHTSQFRLVGAGVKLDSKKGWTDLEKERRTRWQQTVKNVGLSLLPSGWFTNKNRSIHHVPINLWTGHSFFPL